MDIKTAYSTKGTVEDATKDIASQLADVKPKMVIYFASMSYPPEKLAPAMESAFSPAVVFGCSTAGEIVSGHMLKNSIVAMALSENIIADLKLCVLENIKTENKVSEVYEEFGKYFGASMSDMDFTKYVGIVLFDGMSGAEEGIIDKMGDLSDVIFIGGSAGDDLAFTATYLYANGKAYTNAALLVLTKPAGKFEILKTQSFTPKDKKFKVTKCDEALRKVIELNGKPAAEVYADAIGQSVDSADDMFRKFPIGLVIDGEPWVRSPQQIVGGKEMLFYCAINQGQEYTLLEGGDIVGDTRKLVEENNKNGELLGLLNFHCILRTLDLEANGETEAYGQVFKDVPTVGFSTYGEQYLGHINQTSTFLAFKK